MAVKRSFKDMLPPLAVPATSISQEPEPQVSPPARDQPPIDSNGQHVRLQAAAASPAPAPAPAAAVQAKARQASAVTGEDDVPAASVRPHYTQLVRKELRVFQDQAMDLKILTMTINNTKLGMGERITDNTLVRVAIDLLLERKADLSGTTESELRDSLNLPPRY